MGRGAAPLQTSPQVFEHFLTVRIGNQEVWLAEGDFIVWVLGFDSLSQKVKLIMSLVMEPFIVSD